LAGIRTLEGAKQFLRERYLGEINRKFGVPAAEKGERCVFETLRNFIPRGAPTASLLIWPDGINARVWLSGSDQPVPINEIIVIGRSIRKLPPGNSRTGFNTRGLTTYSRQVLAFGEDGQASIARSRVGIVGVGGTGSACAEQAVRLGVRDIVIIDPDAFEPSNVTRMYGSFAATARPHRWVFGNRARPKVEIVAEHLRRINPQATITPLRAHVAETHAAHLLLDRDAIFVCTDDHWGRAVVNQISYQYLIPSLSLGVRIDARNGSITGAAGGLDLLRPDLPCLWCKGFLVPDRIAAESMSKKERKVREREGYVQDLDIPAPSVISLNTTLARLAVTSFLQLLTDFMGDSGEISRLNYQILEGTISRGTSQSEKVCVCKTSRGFGDLKVLQTASDLRHLYEK